jgi:hypothetical protein
MFVCPALSPFRLDFPLLFQNGRFGNVQNLFQVDRSSGQDWRSVLRETCRYLEVVGGRYSNLYMWVPLDDIRHGIELNSDAEVD